MAKMLQLKRNWAARLAALQARGKTSDVNSVVSLRRSMRKAGLWRYRHHFELRAAAVPGVRVEDRDWRGTMRVRIDWHLGRVARAVLHVWSTAEARWRRVASLPCDEEGLPTRELADLGGYEPEEQIREACDRAYNVHLRSVEQELLGLAVWTMFGAACTVPEIQTQDYGGTGGAGGPPPLSGPPEAAALSKDDDEEEKPRSGCALPSTIEPRVPGARGDVRFAFDGLFKKDQNDEKRGRYTKNLAEAMAQGTPAEVEKSVDAIEPFQLEGGRCAACGEQDGHAAGCPAQKRSGPVAPPDEEVENDAQALKRKGMAPVRDRDGGVVRLDGASVGRLEHLERALSDLLIVASQSTDGNARYAFEELAKAARAEDRIDDIGAVTYAVLRRGRLAPGILDEYVEPIQQAWQSVGAALGGDLVEHGAWWDRGRVLLEALIAYYVDDGHSWQPKAGEHVELRPGGPRMLLRSGDVDPGQHREWACPWLVAPPHRDNVESLAPQDFQQLTDAQLLQRFRPARQLKR